MNAMSKLVQFLSKLEELKIHYTLGHHHDEAIMVLAAVPGERWEVEFYESGEVEVEIFRSGGVIEDERVLERLLAEFKD